MSAIPLGEAALCCSCLVIFSVRDRRCPTCSAECGWYLIEKSRAPIPTPENAEAAPARAASEGGDR